MIILFLVNFLLKKLFIKVFLVIYLFMINFIKFILIIFGLHFNYFIKLNFVRFIIFNHFNYDQLLDFMLLQFTNCLFIMIYYYFNLKETIIVTVQYVIYFQVMVTNSLYFLI